MKNKVGLLKTDRLHFNRKYTHTNTILVSMKIQVQIHHHRSYISTTITNYLIINYLIKTLKHSKGDENKAAREKQSVP